MIDQNSRSRHEPLSPIVADKLLELLSTDDDFRSLFQADPPQALARLGHQPAEQHTNKSSIAAGESFYCMTSANLASKEEIEQSREELKHFLTSHMDHHVIFCFEAGKISAALRTK